MAKLLFFLEAIFVLVVLPLWPGLEGRYGLVGLAALGGALSALDPVRPLASQGLSLAVFALAWSFLGLLVGRILHEVVTQLAQRVPAPLLVLTDGIRRRFGLTPREGEAMQAVLDGLTYRGAAQKLFISPATVKSHVLSVYQKTGTGNKIELLRLVEVENSRIHQKANGPLSRPGSG